MNFAATDAVRAVGQRVMFFRRDRRPGTVAVIATRSDL
jgi:hypothetical protein